MERERKNLEKRRKTILLSTERRQVTKNCAIDALYFQTNFIDKFLDDKILKFLRNRSSAFQMLPGHRDWN